MVHIIENTTVMLNEIEQVVKPDARIMITGLRRGILALFVKKFRTAFTSEEAQKDFIERPVLVGLRDCNKNF